MTLRVLRLILPTLALVLGVLAVAGPASAAGTLGIKSLSGGAKQLTRKGHSYVCYKGDVCIFRKKFEAYYKCQTVDNHYAAADGFVYNNQTGGAKTVVVLYAREYIYTPGQYSTGDWSAINYVETC